MLPSVEDLAYLKSLRDAPGGRLPPPQDHITKQRVAALRLNGFVRAIQRSLLELGEDYVEITVAGRDAVSAWERSLRKDTDEAAQKNAEKHDERKFQVWIALLSSTAGVLLTLLVEHVLIPLLKLLFK